jgi:hypothetical protein
MMRLDLDATMAKLLPTIRDAAVMTDFAARRVSRVTRHENAGRRFSGVFAA